jgi:hypothetical protein
METDVMTLPTPDKALLPAPPMPSTPPAELIARVAKTSGVSPFRQLSEVARLSLGKTKLNMDAYYANRVYRKELSGREKRAFVGLAANYAMNQQLNPLEDTDKIGFIRNKVRYGELLQAEGLATTHLQAVAAQSGDHGGARILREVPEIVAFLRQEAVYPLFGKPASGSRSVGSALIAAYDAESDQVILGNGRQFDVTKFAQEMHEDYAKGFLLQTAVTQDARMTALAGPALGSVRIVTVNTGEGPQVLYTVWKMPGPKAMSDNFWQAGSMLGKIDEESGTVVTCRRGTGPDMEDLSTHPVSGAPIIGFEMPHWQAAKALAVKGHALMPEFGVFGWDMGISEDGPLIIEANVNPFHPIYQLATGRGIKNPDFWPLLQAAIQRRTV